MNSSALEIEIMSGRPIVTFTVGDSMRPLLYNRKTMVGIVRISKDLKQGDLPVYKRENGQLVIHRIIKVDDNYYYTRGDNCINLERIPKRSVLGVVTVIFRNRKMISVNNKLYHAYVGIWNIIYPFRASLYMLRRILKERFYVDD